MVSKGKSSRREANSRDTSTKNDAETRNEIRSSEPLQPNLGELEDLETETGMEEVDLDQAVVDTVAVDEADDDLIAEDDIYDDLEDEEIIDDRPQAVTQSYGTGLQGRPSDRSGRYSRRETHSLNEPESGLMNGDDNVKDEDADAVGEEGVGGTVATPDQNVVDELGAAVGLEMGDRAYLETNDVLERRDDKRWELDPQSAEDYEQHNS